MCALQALLLQPTDPVAHIGAAQEVAAWALATLPTLAALGAVFDVRRVSTAVGWKVWGRLCNLQRRSTTNQVLAVATVVCAACRHWGMVGRGL